MSLRRSLDTRFRPPGISLWWAAILVTPMLLASCRGRRGPALPQPQDFSELVVLGLFVIGFGLLVLKIVRG